MNKFIIGAVSVFLVVLIFFGLWIGITPTGRVAWNTWFFKVQKVDDVTRYETVKKVEDTCRAMIASYESDKLIYEQYKNSNDKEKQEWVEQAKMRANKTVLTYNNYILENSFVWEDSIPADIKRNLEVVE